MACGTFFWLFHGVWSHLAIDIENLCKSRLFSTAVSKVPKDVLELDPAPGCVNYEKLNKASHRGLSLGITLKRAKGPVPLAQYYFNEFLNQLLSVFLLASFRYSIYLSRARR